MWRCGFLLCSDAKIRISIVRGNSVSSEAPHLCSRLNQLSFEEETDHNTRNDASRSWKGVCLSSFLYLFLQISHYSLTPLQRVTHRLSRRISTLYADPQAPIEVISIHIHTLHSMTSIHHFLTSHPYSIEYVHLSLPSNLVEPCSIVLVLWQGPFVPFLDLFIVDEHIYTRGM